MIKNNDDDVVECIEHSIRTYRKIIEDGSSKMAIIIHNRKVAEKFYLNYNRFKTLKSNSFKSLGWLVELLNF